MSIKNFPIRAWLRLFGALTLLLLFTVNFSGCSQGQKPPRVASPSDLISETVGSVALLRLDALAFAGLGLQDRIAAYYLAQAVLAGRDIPYDQLHPRHLEIRKFWEDISRDISYGATDQVLVPFWTSLKLLWIYDGFYNLASQKKLTFPMGEREITQLEFLALSNSGGRLGSLEEINLRRTWIADSLFNPSIQPVLYDCSILRETSFVSVGPLQFSQDVSSGEIQGYASKFPLNSRLIKRESRLIEQVYRTGDDVYSAGPYADQLEQVIENLEKARPYLPAERVVVVDQLIQHFRTGAAANYDSACSLQQKTTSLLDFVLGFDDTRFDPFGRKGLWTGILFLRDGNAQTRLDAILKSSPDLIADFPGQITNRSNSPAQIRCAQLLTAIGANGPLCPDVYYRSGSEKPPGSAGEAILFTNVISARSKARMETQELQMCADESEKSACRKYGADLSFFEAAISTGYNIQAMAAEINRPICSPDRGFDRAILQKAVEKLAFLWSLKNGAARSVDILSDPAAVVEGYRRFVRRFQLAAGVTDAFADPIEIGALQVIGSWLSAKNNATEPRNAADGPTAKHFDEQFLHDQAGVLGREIVDLLKAGDQGKIEAFTKLYLASPPVEKPAESRERGRDDRRRDQAVTNTKVVREAFILPLIKAEFNPMGGIPSVVIEQPADFTAEMMLWGGQVRQGSGK
ncbi:MAG: hypothetical protein NTW14_07765 [bacterium]|nr:hypothetical protein [bacterium]